MAVAGPLASHVGLSHHDGAAGDSVSQIDFRDWENLEVRNLYCRVKNQPGYAGNGREG